MIEHYRISYKMAKRETSHVAYKAFYNINTSSEMEIKERIGREISTYSVILSLNDLVGFRGLGCHLQPARTACFQLLYLTHTDTADRDKG